MKRQTKNTISAYLKKLSVIVLIMSISYINFFYSHDCYLWRPKSRTALLSAENIPKIELNCLNEDCRQKDNIGKKI